MNLWRSSRVRIALVSVLTSAAVLIAFGGIAWWQMRATRLADLDRELKGLGELFSLAARWDLKPDRLTQIFQQRFGQDRSSGCIFAVQQKRSGLTKSDNWPATLDPSLFAHSQETVLHEMPGGGPGPPPGDDEFEGGRGRRGKGQPPRPEPSSEDRLLEELRSFPPFDAPGGFGVARTFVLPPGMEKPLLYAPVLYSADAGDTIYRLGVFGHAISGTIIWVGFDQSVFGQDLMAMARGFAIALPVALILVALGAWLAARRSLVPVERLSAEMENVSPGSLHHRLDPAGTDREFHRIIHAYNAMLGRLERSYQQATRFSADASHELKTPLAVMRATLEKALGSCADGSTEQGTYATMLDEIDHLQSIIEALLLLSRADAGKLVLSREQLDFAAWLRPLTEDASLMAESEHITIEEDLAVTASIAADPVLLHRAVHNLFRNAVAYNREHGIVRCHTFRRDQFIVLRVANTGAPIPQAERARIFERFARGSNAGGTGEGRGLGIGLSLAREIATAHGGALDLVDGEPGFITFELSLPAAV